MTVVRLEERLGDWLLELLHSHNDQGLTILGMPWLQELMHSHNVQSLIILGMSGQQELMRLGD